MTDNTYNGWTNYETWSVHLERFDGLVLEDLALDDNQTPTSLGHFLRSWVENDIYDIIDSHFTSILYEYMQKVNWTEIAEHIIDKSKN